MQEIKSGIYVGYSEAQNSGNCFDTGITDMFSYSDSALSKGTESGNLIGWKMTPEKLFVLFDFTKTTYIEKISIGTPELSPEERKVWGIALINVSYCEEIGSRYYTLGRIYPDNDIHTNELAINKSVRFIKLEINRSPWRAYPMPKIVFCGEDNLNANNIPLTEKEMHKQFLYEAVGVDEYGQAMFVDWEGKIYSDEQMKKNAIEEFKKYEGFVPNERYDKYGGIKGFKKLDATGFFRVEKIDNIWWFITPEGNPYIMKGVDLVCYSEMSYHTPIYVRDTDDTRGAFEELPDKNEYACAYEISPYGIPVLNYLKLNLYRKYGDEFDKKWVEMTQKRLADWGFNAASKWVKHDDIKMPYIKSLHSNSSFKKVRWLIDPYADDFKINVENNLKDILLELKDDPYLIGYHYTNESGFDREIFTAMLSSNRDCAMKKGFINFLSDSYSIDEISKLLKLSFNEFDDLLDISLPSSVFDSELITDFISATAKIYYKTIRDAIKKYDPNHLYMGAGLTPEWRSTYDWNIGGLEYLDVLSFDHYTKSSDHWLERYAKLDFPIVNIEFSFTVSDRGMSPIFDSIHCKNQIERGEEYRKFLEYSFSLPQFIGTGFFILNDQPVSGRCNEDGSYGECHNFGLIDTTDEPYWDFINYVKETHKYIENIHANKQII